MKVQRERILQKAKPMRMTRCKIGTFAQERYNYDDCDPSGGGGHQKGLAIRNNCLEEAEAEEEQQDKKKFG